MNEDTFQGEGRDVGGKLKETAGNVLGDGGLQASGLGDQLSGKAQKTIGALKDAISSDGPILDRAKSFAKARPFAAAALAGVLGIALLNTIRGRK